VRVHLVIGREIVTVLVVDDGFDLSLDDGELLRDILDAIDDHSDSGKLKTNIELGSLQSLNRFVQDLDDGWGDDRSTADTVGAKIDKLLAKLWKIGLDQLIDSLGVLFLEKSVNFFELVHDLVIKNKVLLEAHGSFVARFLVTGERLNTIENHLESIGSFSDSDIFGMADWHHVVGDHFCTGCWVDEWIPESRSNDDEVTSLAHIDTKLVVVIVPVRDCVTQV